MTKTKRGSDENLFSISGASEALGRARRTIARAMSLSGAQPDAVRHGLKLWRMAKIIDAVNRHTQAPILSTGTAGEQSQLVNDATEAFAEFDTAWDALMKLKTLAARRAAAHKMAPLLNAVTETMELRDLADDLHPEHASLRAQNVWRLCLRGFELHCKWSFDEAWRVFNPEEEDQAA